MPIQKFASQAYNYKANNYTHNHILLNSSGESLSSSHYSFKNGTGSTSSNCSSNDDSPIINGSNNLYPNTHSLPTKHFAHESEKACDKLTAQKNSKTPDYLPNGHFINMDNNFTVNLSSTDRNMPNPYEKLNVLYKNNTTDSTPKNNQSNISEFNIVSTPHNYSPLTLSNTCKDDEKTPLLSSQASTELNNYQANESFLKTHLTTTTTNVPNANESNQKSESTIIMIDEDDDTNYSNKDRNLVNNPTQRPLNLRQGFYTNHEMSNDYSAQTTSLQNTIDSFMLGNSNRWEKEVKISDLSAISNRPHHNKSLELGMASCMGNVAETSQQATTAKSNHTNSKSVTDYDQQICFFNSPSTSSSHNTFSPYNVCNLDFEMKVMNDGGRSKYNLDTSIKPTLGDDILKKCSKSKKKKAITNNGENSLNYPMDDNLTRVAYPQKDNYPGKNSNDSKSKIANKREKRINKNVRSQYIAKDDQGKKDINFLVAFIEGTQNSIATTTYKDYKTSAHARTKDHIRPAIHLTGKGEGDDLLGENSSLVDSTFSVTTLVNENAFLTHDIDDEHLHETISDTQSQKSQPDRSSTTYKNMKKHFSSEDLRPHLFEHHSLLFSPSPKVPLDICALALDDNSTKSDEDYSTPPQDFQENFQIVQKKQYRKENPVQPPQDFGRNRGPPANRNAPRTSGNPSSSSHNTFVPRSNKEGGRVVNINNTKPGSKDCQEPFKNEEKSGESTLVTEQTCEDKTHPKALSSSKTENCSGRDRNVRHAYAPPHNARNFGRGRPGYSNHPNHNGASRAIPSPQVEVKESNVVQNFNAELDFPPLVCPKTSKSINNAELVTAPEAKLNQSLLQTSESPSSTEAESCGKADLDGSEGKKDPNAVENDDVKSSYASMLTKSKQQQAPVPALNPAVSGKAKEQTPSQTTPLSNSETLKFHDSSILEVSNELCHQSAGASPANPASSGLIYAPAPSSPRVIFVNSDNSKSLNFGKNKFRSAHTDENEEEGGEAKLNFTFGFDIDSPQVRDIINAKDDQDDHPTPSQQQPQAVQEPTTPSARVLEWLEAERAKMAYLAPYFANIWAQMQKHDPSPSYT